MAPLALEEMRGAIGAALEAAKGGMEMILSDEVIKDSLNYHNHRISLSAEQLLDWVDKAIEGEEVCDFAESFQLVRKAVDLYSRIQGLEAKLWDLREIIERNSKDLPSEFSQLLDDHFWEIAQAEKEAK